MQEKASPKVALLRERHGEYEIVSNGRIVWINDSERCIARFTPNGLEFFDRMLARYPVEGPNAEDWSSFLSLLQEKFLLTVGDQHRPERVVLH